MIFAIAKFIANLFGLDISKVQRVIVIILIALIGVAVLMFGLWVRSCGKKTPKLDEAEILKAQQAIAVEDRKTMIEVLTNSDIRAQQIDGNLSNAKEVTVNSFANSRQTWANANTSDMAAELERRSKE